MELYGYSTSSTTYRVRIALALKGLDYHYRSVDLKGGEQRGEAFRTLNPARSVPLLVKDDGDLLSQSLAIIDYLDQTWPEPRLIPWEPLARARVLELAQLVACDIHPLNNQRVLRYLEQALEIDDERRHDWYRHWIDEGLGALEELLLRHGHGAYCFGDSPTMADCCLVPQVVNALRMGCPTQAYGRVMSIYQHCQAQPAFQRAAPQNQPDYPGS